MLFILSEYNLRSVQNSTFREERESTPLNNSACFSLVKLEPLDHLQQHVQSSCLESSPSSSSSLACDRKTTNDLKPPSWTSLSMVSVANEVDAEKASESGVRSTMKRRRYCSVPLSVKMIDMFEPMFDLNRPNLTSIMQRPVDMGTTKRYKNRNSTELDKKRKFACTYTGCLKSYTCRSHLREHMRVHMSEKKYHCTWPQCKWKFIRSVIILFFHFGFCL